MGFYVNNSENSVIINYKLKNKGWVSMTNYRFTAFEQTGETLFDETWTFENDEAAKIEGQKQIEEKGVSDKTHRLVNSQGKLILFHV